MLQAMKTKVWTIVVVGLLLVGSWLYMAGFEFPWQGSDTAQSPSPSATPPTSPTATKGAAKPSPLQGLTQFNVPFAPQAPFGEWSDARQQDGCEEASVIMAMHWVKGDTTITLEEAKNEILAIADWEQAKYGNYHDTSARDTVERIFKDYYNYNKVRVEEDVNTSKIIQELQNGNLVVVPADGIALNNPHFTPPGPERHMLVITGYDSAKDEFITNDPGTRFGKNYRYKTSVLFNAIRDYPTGHHLPISGEDKNIIVVEK